MGPVCDAQHPALLKELWAGNDLARGRGAPGDAHLHALRRILERHPARLPALRSAPRAHQSRPSSEDTPGHGHALGTQVREAAGVRVGTALGDKAEEELVTAAQQGRNAVGQGVAFSPPRLGAATRWQVGTDVP